ncbi:4'-phosphopantetheinyl transferase family protein [Paenibacillus agri]|uniref:4'-phosphopantetheinyl transferase superfamily protein n=1 Tax=Paenibacillus agri TaxID=2744309 RepID=A0A850EI65_9BACL|nr:4'-phosphopantetheinyl transferase superfamily protein [Paenibacillus agri]NUU60578.1 4'-phosphopantetheinyl transferase superfamily protein [Paenibacillus agri]
MKVIRASFAQKAIIDRLRIIKLGRELTTLSPVELNLHLTTPELELFNRLSKNPRRQRQFYYGRLLCKELLISTQSTVQKMNEINIINEEELPFKGRPILEGSANASISISHEDELVVGAISMDSFIGVDYCKIRQLPVMNAVFSKYELKVLNDAYDPAEREFTSCLMWSIKEAVLKAFGVGFHYGFQAIEILMTPDELDIVLNDDRLIEMYDSNMLKIDISYFTYEDYVISTCRLMKKEQIGDNAKSFA